MTLPVLVGLHIPKTGGTTCQHHVASLGADIGYHNSIVANADRVLNGVPLLPLWPPDKIAAVLSAFGHRITLEEALVLPCEQIRMFTIVRDPFDYFVSSYKHHRRTVAGQPMSAIAFFKAQQSNPQSEHISSAFGRLGDRDAGPTAQGVASSLSMLDYVLWTSRLDTELPALFGLIGLNDPVARMRVYSEQPDLDGISRADVIKHDPIDAEIAGAVGRQSRLAIGNPFRGPPTNWDDVKEALADRLGDPVRVSYFATFEYLAKRHALRALALAVDRRDSDPSGLLLREYLGKEYDAFISRPVSPEEETEIVRALRRLKFHDEAREVAYGLVERAPEHVPAHLELARLLWKTDPGRAAEACRAVLEINPSHDRANRLLRAINGADPASNPSD